MTSWARTVLDFATQAAKGRGHSAVEPRHVVFAVCSLLKNREGVAALLARALELLPPRGMGFVTPKPDREAEAILGRCVGESEALEIARQWIESGGSMSPPAPTVDASGGLAKAVDPGADRPATQNPGPAVAAPGRRESADDVLRELDALVGLAPVKAKVRQIRAVLEANRVRGEGGLPPVSPSLHLVFTGSPGTGKTTVARLMARLYAALGVIPNAKFTETKPKDLVAGFVRQTAQQTQQLIDRVRPGILFIDEAYGLAGDDRLGDFGAEAIATLLAEMENRRQDLAVIVAGYQREMEGFILSNPGLSSRFKTFVEFPDYSVEELVLIFTLMAQEKRMTLGDEANEALSEVFAVALQGKHFGNARFVRNLFEQAFTKRAEVASSDGKVEIHEVVGLDANDIRRAAVELKVLPVRNMVFRP